MKSAGAKIVTTAIAFIASTTCGAFTLRPGVWVYDSPRTLYVLRLNEKHGCHFAIFVQDPKFEDAGPCELLTNGAEIMVDLTFAGVFANGLPVTGLKQLRLVPSPDGQSLISISHTPSAAFLHMSDAEAEKLIATRK
jgi:hypothetical protein